MSVKVTTLEEGVGAVVTISATSDYCGAQGALVHILHACVGRLGIVGTAHALARCGLWLQMPRRALGWGCSGGVTHWDATGADLVDVLPLKGRDGDGVEVVAESEAEAYRQRTRVDDGGEE